MFYKLYKENLCKNHICLLMVLLIGLSFLGLLIWYSMPIYPDEIAARLSSGRYIQDHGLSQKLFHFCTANSRETPLIFVIPALLFSWIDLTISPVYIRFFPFIVTLTAIVISISLAVRKGTPHAAVIATTALMGVAGSGLILARAEYVQVLNVACCFGAFYFIESGSQRLSLRCGIAAILMLSVLMSLYGHIQGLLFLPLTLFMVFQLLGSTLGKVRTAILMLSLLIVVTYATISFHKLSCPEHPEIAQYVADMVFDWGRLKSLGIGEWLRSEIDSYYVPFLYRNGYTINYLPGIVAANTFQHVLLHWLNLGIKIILLLNLILFFCVGVIGSAYLSKKIWLRIRSRTAFWAPSPHIATVLTFLLIVMPVLFLFFYDSAHNFYRVFFINLLIAIVLAVIISRVFKARVPAYAKAYFVVCGAVVYGSLLVNLWWFKNKLDAGFEGPSVTIRQDWKSIDRDVEKLVDDCGITLSKGRIIVDDMTYDSLKQYPNLYPITYLHLSALLTGVRPINVINEIKPNSMLTRCEMFRATGVEFQKSRNRLCCVNYNYAGSKKNE